MIVFFSQSDSIQNFNERLLNLYPNYYSEKKSQILAMLRIA